MGRRQHLLVGLLVFAAALAAVLVLRSGSEPHPPYPKAQAVAAAQRNRDVGATLRANSWTVARVIPLDDDHWRVTFFDGPRVLLDAAVAPNGAVDAWQARLPHRHPPGSAVLWSPALIALLASLFVIAVGAGPLRSLRNLDALVVAAGFSASALFNDARLIGPHVYAGIATLAYLTVRCAQVGFAAPAAEREVDPLYRRAFGSASSSRVLRLVAGAVVIAGLMLTITSTGLSDVALAALAGATKLNHGDLPYGRLTHDVVHGDTYPLLTYVLYMPVAAISPVRDSFDSLDGALWLNAAALAGVSAVLYRLAGRGDPGTASVLAWMAFPPVVLAASGGGNDVPTAFFVALALLLFARPVASATALALSALAKVIPGAALIAWLPRLRGRALVSALAATAATLAAGLLLILALGGTDGVRDAWESARFQFQRGSWYSLWRQAGLTGLQPVFQAATVAFAAVAAFAIWQGGAEAFGLRRTAALAGAIIALLQIAANYWTYAYLPWLLPFILVALFPPAPPRSRPPASPAP
jgi:hypothetical protein